jgi:hypothetical protein
VEARLAGGASPTTINRSLEVVRTILNRAARSYRDGDGRPWLEAMRPLITMVPESPRLPYPITWKEQDTLFRKLLAHLGRMALFAVNTGLRDSNVCGLQWTWEVAVPELGRSVFVSHGAAPIRSAPPAGRSSSASHRSRRCGRTIDATNRELLGIRYYGCSIDDLYNRYRARGGIGGIPP